MIVYKNVTVYKNEHSLYFAFNTYLKMIARCKPEEIARLLQNNVSFVNKILSFKDVIDMHVSQGEKVYYV